MKLHRNCVQNCVVEDLFTLQHALLTSSNVALLPILTY